MTKTLELHAGELSLTECRNIFAEHVPLKLSDQTHAKINACHQELIQLLQNEKTIYGINTGFGLLANKQIPSSQLQELQHRLVLSHTVGVGPLLADEIVRLMMVLKINSLACGYSGVRLELVEALLSLYNERIYPCIPAQGSVGASGDLAPLAHLASALIGLGKVRKQSQQLLASLALNNIKQKPLNLAPKEGLALLNGTQASTALAMTALFICENLFNAALIAGALSVDAAKASHAPFDERIHKVRGHQGQQRVAQLYRELLNGSQIKESHANCERVQDPYSLRCQPQVMGACLDQMQYVAKILLIEANAVSDNPLIFSDSHEVLSGGNFHAEPVAFAADNLALSIAEIGALSERRIALLIDSRFSQLPSFLVKEGGINSGFMIVQVTAAALASENKSLAHPASVDSLPTSANQEDHVSMATYAARRLHNMLDNSIYIIAIELLAACQGLDFNKPLSTSRKLQAVHQFIRSKVPFYDQDRSMAEEIELIAKLIKSGDFNQFMLETLY